LVFLLERVRRSAANCRYRKYKNPCEPFPHPTPPKEKVSCVLWFYLARKKLFRFTEFGISN
jgi:hypothetical protein